MSERSGSTLASPCTLDHRDAEQSAVDRLDDGERATSAPCAPPLFILAPPRSYTSLVCAMLGAHPQMYGFPELHLLSSKTVGAWWKACDRANFSRQDGPLRAIAELFYGGQTEGNVQQAHGWLKRRSHMSTGLVFELLAQRVYPRIPVEKSPSLTYSLVHMKRAHDMFPAARYLHLLRHPRTHAESVLEQLESKRARGACLGDFWRDPPLGWYANHRHICDFLEAVPPDRHMRVRAEDLLQHPDELLASIARWLALRDDLEAIEAMKHPERSPYAHVGPKGATFGADRKFLQAPEFRQRRPTTASLDDPVSWPSESAWLLPRVRNLAREFGYE
jgi:Sulfotransferase family